MRSRVKDFRQQHYYDTRKYVVLVLGGVVSDTYRRLPESRNFRQTLLVDSWQELFFDLSPFAPDNSVF